MPKPVPIPVPLPVRGLHRGVAHARRPAGTTDRASNVRTVAPVSDRLGIGKRSGLAKALTTAVGSIKAGTSRVNHIATMQEAAGTPAAAEGSYQTVTERWSSTTAANPANLGGDLAAFTKTISGGYVQNYYDFQVSTATSPASATDPGLLIDWYRETGDPALGYPGVAVLYPCAGEVSCLMWANGNVAHLPSDPAGAVNECVGFGPFLRGSSDLDYFIGCCLLESAADEVKLSIVEVNGTTRTTLGQSAAITLNNNASVTTDALLRLTISATATTITARVEWTNGGSGGPSADTDITLLVANSTNPTYTRAGWAAQFTNGTPGAVDNRWAIRELMYTKVVPNSPEVLFNASRLRDDPEEEQFFLPDGLEGVRLAAGSPLTVGTQFTGSSTSQPEAPHIDQLNDLWYSAASPSPGDYAYVTTTAAQSSEAIVDTKGHETLSGSYTDNDIMGAVFRVSSDRLTYLAVEVYHTGTTQYGTSKQDHLQIIRFVAVVAGTRTTLQSYTYNGGGGTTQAHMPVFNKATRLEFKDSGGAASSMTITVGFNGITWRTFTPSAMSGWTAPIAAALSDTGRVGASLSSPTATIPPGTFESNGFRIVSRAGSSAAKVAESESRVAVFTTGRVYTGNLQDDEIELADGSGPLNPVVLSAVIGRKWYAVDGGGIWVIDPAAETCAALTATAGTLPSDPRLCCAFRRRLVVAQFDSDPTLWACSRTADPSDWDYGADPEETAAVIGNSGIVGQPADPITALIPYQNDVLLFGCPGSIYQLIGDPGYGGRLEKLTSETGVVGPRAWVFDGRDVLWFIGNSGLMRWSPGESEPTPVSSGRMPSLSQLDATSIFVQMGYDPWEQTVTVYKTPVDGVTAGTHIVYHVPTDSFVSEDSFPVGQGPWAVAQPYGSNASDRRPLLGGNDGYVRRMVDGTNGDDGTAISCEVDIPIPDSRTGGREQIIKDIVAWGSDGSASTTWRWLTAASPAEAEALSNGSAYASGTWFATSDGYQSPQAVRAGGGSHVLRVSQSSASDTFGIEQISVTAEERGRRR